MMHAYDQTLLTKARTTMAWMFDYAVYIQELDLADFYHLFLDSSISKKFESGDSSTIAGKSGAELAYHVLKENGMEVSLKQPVFTMDRTPEYWLGWSLSYYQWVKNFSFKQITDVTDIDELLLMYKKYHEMDIEHFVIELDRRRKNVFSESALKRFRAYAMLGQGELAERTGIPVRTIQQYEQRQKNINNAKAETIFRLAKALYCNPDDLFEK